MPSFETIEFTVTPEHVATITLNRPKALNSFNQTMLDEFVEVWRRCREDARQDILPYLLQICIKCRYKPATSCGLRRTVVCRSRSSKPC